MRENRLLGVFCTLLGDEENASADKQQTAGNVEDGRTDATGGREGRAGTVSYGNRTNTLICVYCASYVIQLNFQSGQRLTCCEAIPILIDL